ncbi:hypothetical protein TNCV_5060091 [Trichonephila clavipes]|nr:hypothetical protein TNCV_5060091 [Trichonephila clavipes]
MIIKVATCIPSLARYASLWLRRAVSSSPNAAEKQSCLSIDQRYICLVSKISYWYGVLVWREGCHLMGRPRHLTEV